MFYFLYIDEARMAFIQNKRDLICPPREASTLNSDEEMISDDEENIIPSNFPIIPKFKGSRKVLTPSFGSKMYCGPTSSSLTRQAEALHRLNESKPTTSWKGGRGKGKRKFSFRFRPCKEEVYWSSVLKDEKDKLQFVSEAVEPVPFGTSEHSMAEILEERQGERISDSETSGVCVGVEAFGDGATEHSMTELFDGLQEKTGLLNSNHKRNHKVKTRQLAYEQGTVSLGDRNMKDDKDKLQFVSEAVEPRALGTTGHSMDDLFEDYQGERISDSETSGVCVGVGAFGHRATEHSMTELFDGLQEKTGLPNRNLKEYQNHRQKSKTRQHAYKKNTVSLGDRNMNDEDPPEPLSCGTSSDEEMKNQNLKPIIPEIRKQTMAEQFHEVLGASCVNNEGLIYAAPKSGSGLFARLQQVMHIEKEREVDFSRKLLAGDEANSIDVKILSKYLAAKLIVCQCFYREYECNFRNKSSQPAQENIERKRTIIFNSKLCSNVELEVGNLIRIYPPWYGLSNLNVEHSYSKQDSCISNLLILKSEERGVSFRK